MEDQIEVLRSCGMSAGEIAEQLGIPVDYVIDVIDNMD